MTPPDPPWDPYCAHKLPYHAAYVPDVSNLLKEALWRFCAQRIWIHIYMHIYIYIYMYIHTHILMTVVMYTYACMQAGMHA